MKPSTLRLLFEVLFHRPWTRILILASSFAATIFGLLGPFFQKEFIDLLSHQNTAFPWVRDWLILGSPITLVFVAFACILLSLGFSQLTQFIGAREAFLMQKKLAHRLYDQALRLRADSLQGRPVGDIVSVYATDVPGATVFLEQSVPVGASIVFPLILAPMAISYFFEIPIFPTLAVMGVVGVLNFSMAFRQSKYFFNFKRLAGDRIGLVSEWVQNIRALRILGWMRAFEAKIFATREIETDNRIAMVTNGQFMNTIGSSVTYALNIVVVASMVTYSAHRLTAGALLALLWIIGIFLIRPFRQMPWFFTFIFDSWTSLRRVDDFLMLTNDEPFSRKNEFQKIHEGAAPATALKIENLNLKIGATEVLKSIDLEVKKGEFVAIVGEVGAGKSLLLLSLMGETGAEFDQYQLGGNDAKTLPLHQLRQFFTFVPQEGFIMSSTLRDNVAFEYDTPKTLDVKIESSLGRAQFQLDQERIDGGLDAEIGERGVNLSGGQKQRVSLARVDFHQSPIILMDDCLSAVDVETEQQLIDSLLKGAWRNATRILVTHRLTVLDEVDRVIFLETGKVIAHGRFDELLKSNQKFREFTATVAQESLLESHRQAGASETALVSSLNDDLKGPNDGDL